MDKESYLRITNDLIILIEGNRDATTLSQAAAQLLTLLQNLYGEDDVRINALLKYKNERFDPSPWNDFSVTYFRAQLLGLAKGIKIDIENGLIFNLKKQIIGEIVADFITLAKKSSEEDIKDVAAVLGSAALEDSLKRYAELNGLIVDDKDMSEVINALKSKGLLKGPQATVVTSYVTTRNKAFHAEFEKIEMPEVKGLIAFTEEFILKNLF